MSEVRGDFPRALSFSTSLDWPTDRPTGFSICFSSLPPSLGFQCAKTYIHAEKERKAKG
jgi:hypothetical protein